MLIRGLRAVSDFEYEFQLANMNRRLMPDPGERLPHPGGGELLHLLHPGEGGGAARWRHPPVRRPLVAQAIAARQQR